jgi:primosomal protein N' (replication factor Y)
VLLDAEQFLARADLRAAEWALSRWFSAAALVRPASAGGTVVVCAPADLPAVQALIRLDPTAHAERELAERQTAGLSPALLMASLTGPADTVRTWLQDLTAPPGFEVLGPAPVEALGPPRQPTASTASPAQPPPPEARAVLRGSRLLRHDLVRQLRALAARQSLRRTPGHVRIKIDPYDLG